MDIKDLLVLVEKVANGENDLENAAIGFQGYGFVFKDFRQSNDSYVITSQSGKICEMGAYHNGHLSSGQSHDIWAGHIV